MRTGKRRSAEMIILLGRVGAGIVGVRHEFGRAAHDDAGRHLHLREFLF